jgi:Protein of unknown function (DUF3570)
MQLGVRSLVAIVLVVAMTGGSALAQTPDASAPSPAGAASAPSADAAAPSTKSPDAAAPSTESPDAAALSTESTGAAALSTESPDAPAPSAAGAASAPSPDSPAPFVDKPSVEAPARPPHKHESNIVGHVAADYGQYVDTDHVIVETPSIRGGVSNPLAGWSVDAEYLMDIVSAASVDIVSTASRRYQEVRQAASLEGSYKPQTFGGQLRASFSDEPDYVSWSGGGSVTQDLADKNVTWRAGYEYGHDVAGRTGTSFSVFSHTIQRHAFNAAVTLVMSPASFISIVGDVILESGDSSKPYRYVPLFAPDTAVPTGASVDLVNSLRVSERPHEQLPLSRQRYAITGSYAHRYHAATLRLKYRLYADSWAMLAWTSDSRYLFDLNERIEIGPHLRTHGQTAVSFWQRAYRLGPVFDYPALRTGDRELGPLISITAGMTIRVGLGSRVNPNSWVLDGFLNATGTQYLDDLYLTNRVSVLGGMSLETEL